MGTPGKWFFRFKGSASSTIFTGYADGCSNDAPGIVTENNSSCHDGKIYHIVATSRNNARYASNLAFSTCGSGAMTILEATFTADASVTGIQCGSDTIYYDCINGACTLNSVYNTPGFYASLSACEVACGSGCSGKCISNSEWAQIEGLANQLKNKNCS
jgi:hypothetical protein